MRREYSLLETGSNSVIHEKDTEDVQMRTIAWAGAL